MKIITSIFVILLFLSLTFAQEAKVKLEHVGYGKSQEEVYFTIHNVGSIPITDVTFYVDGKYFETIQGKLSPGRGFEKILYLKPGEHKIEVRTPEGAHDSLNISIVSVEKKLLVEKHEKKEEETLLRKFKPWIILSIIVVILLIIYSLSRKPRLE
jgi:hypothetical protein